MAEENENVVVQALSPHLHGRRVIYSDEDEVTSDNLLAILRQAVSDHEHNNFEEEYLYRYYKGDQPSLYRTKKIRPEIVSRIVENRAYQIVKFKIGYIMGADKAIQYVSNATDRKVTDAVIKLNDFAAREGKAGKDKKLFKWNHITGTAYRMILPNKNYAKDTDSPFRIYILDPRYTFVVYSRGLGNEPVMGVNYVSLRDGKTIFSIYTKDKYYETEGVDKIVKEEANPLGMIPIIEYPLCEEMMGAFEPVISLLDAMNTTACQRQEGVEQFIQALIKFHNVDIDDKDFQKLKDLGGIKYSDVDPSKPGEIDYLTAELNQQQTETLVQHQYQAVLEICGMPSMSDGSTSDSSNNGAVIMKNGWSQAEANAKDTEKMFEESELRALEIMLKISDIITKGSFSLDISNIRIIFTRRNYEDIQTKAQVLTTMLGNDKIAPKLAFEHCGMFVDPERAYIDSKKYYEEQQKKAQETSQQINQQGVNDNGSEDAKSGNDQTDRKSSVSAGESSGN